jgi:hypothetical protein
MSALRLSSMCDIFHPTVFANREIKRFPIKAEMTAGPDLIEVSFRHSDFGQMQCV